MGFRLSEFVEPSVKVHLLEEGYSWVPKRKDFDEDPKEEIKGKSKFSSLGGVLGTSYWLDYASRGRDSSYFGFSFHLFADFGLKWWNILRVCLGRKMPKT